MPVNSHGDYKCKCNPGFAGDKCEVCASNAYPKTVLTCIYLSQMTAIVVL